MPRAAPRSHRYDVLKAAEAGTFDFVLLDTRGPKAFANAPYLEPGVALRIRRESIEELVIPELARRLPQYVDALCTAARRQSRRRSAKLPWSISARHGLGLSEGYRSLPELGLTKGARLMIQPGPEGLPNTGKVFGLLVAGAGFAECYTQPEILWIDLVP